MPESQSYRPEVENWTYGREVPNPNRSTQERYPNGVDWPLCRKKALKYSFSESS